jgi:hypothetical protein
MMKKCPRCLQLFEEREVLGESPIEELADMFLVSDGDANPEDESPECKEEVGMITILGFGE